MYAYAHIRDVCVCFTAAFVSSIYVCVYMERLVCVYMHACVSIRDAWVCFPAALQVLKESCMCIRSELYACICTHVYPYVTPECVFQPLSGLHGTRVSLGFERGYGSSKLHTYIYLWSSSKCYTYMYVYKNYICIMGFMVSEYHCDSSAVMASVSVCMYVCLRIWKYIYIYTYIYIYIYAHVCVHVYRGLKKVFQQFNACVHACMRSCECVYIHTAPSSWHNCMELLVVHVHVHTHKHSHKHMQRNRALKNSCISLSVCTSICKKKKRKYIHLTHICTQSPSS
jgi:hypothetical protein